MKTDIVRFHIILRLYGTLQSKIWMKNKNEKKKQTKKTKTKQKQKKITIYI